MLTDKERQKLSGATKNLNQTESARNTARQSEDEAEIEQSTYDISGLDRKKDQDEYTATPYRWVILAVYSGMTFNSNMIVASFNSLVDPIVTGFGVSEAWVITMMTMSHIIYLPLSIMVTWMFTNF